MNHEADRQMTPEFNTAADDFFVNRHFDGVQRAHSADDQPVKITVSEFERIRCKQILD